jgi:hypothetical protein
VRELLAQAAEPGADLGVRRRGGRGRSLEPVDLRLRCEVLGAGPGEPGLIIEPAGCLPMMLISNSNACAHGRNT